MEKKESKNTKFSSSTYSFLDSFLIENSFKKEENVQESKSLFFSKFSNLQIAMDCSGSTMGSVIHSSIYFVQKLFDENEEEENEEKKTIALKIF